MPTNVLVLNKSWVVTGAGDPEGRESAPVGSLYLREDGAGGTSLYIKETGAAGYLGWKPVAIGGVPSAHAASHGAASADPVDVKALAGYPGGTATFLRADQTFAAPPGGTVAHAATHAVGGADPLTGNLSADRLTLTGAFPQLRVDATLPLIMWSELAASADKKKWRLFASGEILRLDCLNDAESAVTVTIFTISRDGAMVVHGAFTVTGLVTVPGLTVQGPGAGITITDTAAPADAKRWQLATYNNGNLYIETLNDALNAYQGRVTFGRGGSIAAQGPITAATPGCNLADLTVGATNFTAGITMTAGNLNLGPGSLVGGGYVGPTGVVYPGRVDTPGAQTSWYLASHATYGLYCNTGLYLAAGVSAAGPLVTDGYVSAGTTIRAGSGVYERGRGPAMGDWTAGGVASWGSMPVGTADSAYTIIGNTVWLQVNITGCYNASAVAAYYLYTIWTAARRTTTGCVAYMNTASQHISLTAETAAGATHIWIERAEQAAIPAGDLKVAFCICIPLN